VFDTLKTSTQAIIAELEKMTDFTALERASGGIEK